MRVLFLHNRYQMKGGEDTVVNSEMNLLNSNGFTVRSFFASNDGIGSTSSKFKTAISSIYNDHSKQRVCAEIHEFQPDIVHVHNTFPILTPSVFDACQQLGVPVVWTLHNFRTMCANALLLRDAKPCELCVGHLPVPAVVNKCYRNSYGGSLVVSANIAFHSAVGTWRNKVDQFIALTPFSRDKFIAGGIPKHKISIKPNFISDPGIGLKSKDRQGLVYAGRLSVEKGIETLVTAWENLDIPLTIIGEGPQVSLVENLVKKNPYVSYLGKLDQAEILNHFKASQAVIIPSIWYENFPMIFVEAMATGTPVIASKIGSLEYLVQPGHNGLLFHAGDAGSLENSVLKTLSDPYAHGFMCANARTKYLTELSDTANLTLLTHIYSEAISGYKRSAPRS